MTGISASVLLRDAAHDILAVLLPNSALDMTHYHALQLKMLLEQKPCRQAIVCAIAAPDNPAEAESLLFRSLVGAEDDGRHRRICVLHDELERLMRRKFSSSTMTTACANSCRFTKAPGL